MAHAGVNGDMDAVVIALRLQPTQLRIGSIITALEGEIENPIIRKLLISKGIICLSNLHTGQNKNKYHIATYWEQEEERIWRSICNYIWQRGCRRHNHSKHRRCLAMNGKKVVLLDADIGPRNLDVVLGLENRIVYDLWLDVAEGM